MKLCFVVDARSPISQNWIRYFINQGHEVYVISSYPCSIHVLPGANLEILPLGLSSLARIRHDGKTSVKINDTPTSLHYNNLIRSLLAEIRTGRLSFVSEFISNWLIPIDLWLKAGKLRQRITDINPDLVHAMRIPREGTATALAMPDSIPLLLSVWGNDFTLFAKKNMIRHYQTQRSIKRANAIHSDCLRDQELAIGLGFPKTNPTIVAPGSGGINRKIFKPLDTAKVELRQKHKIPIHSTVVINPRGIRSYVQNRTYFSSIPQVLNTKPDTLFISTGMKDNVVVAQWIESNNIPPGNIRLFPSVPHDEMAELFQLSDIIISPSLHDGTPNSLLEGLACGCFPVAGNIESIREWIENNHNGLLCDPTDPNDVAQALIKAINETELRSVAKTFNLRLISERADYDKVMPEMLKFYESLIY